MISDSVLFFVEMVRDFRNVGAIAPSTSWLGREMLSNVFREKAGLKNSRRESLHILEIGPGMGSFTDILIKRLTSKDYVTLVEINPRFCRSMRNKIHQWRAVHEDCPRIDLYEGDIFDFRHFSRFDVIISSLPLNNFESEWIVRLFKHLREMLRSEGVFSYYEYTGLQRVFGKRQRISVQDLICQQNTSRCEVTEERVFRNIPPATVRHMRFPSITNSPGLQRHSEENL